MVCGRKDFLYRTCLIFPLVLRFIQGTSAETPYAFYHWQYIDIFNYFTHHMLTIPPAVWTNAAHKHGVVVIGEPKPQKHRSRSEREDDENG